MNDLLLLTRIHQQKRQIAVLRENVLLEYHENDEDDAGSLVGSIYLGKVERVLKDLGAAFVDIGLSQNGFLPIQESASFLQINKQPLLTGNDVIVQIKKEPKDSKGAFLTRDIVIPGQYVMLMPMNRYIGVSKRIEDKQQAEVLRKRGEKLAGHQFGLVLRANALYCTDADLEEETRRLLKRWQAISETASFRKAPVLLCGNEDLLSRIAEDNCGRNTVTIHADEKDKLPSLPDNCKVQMLDAEALDLEWRKLKISKQIKSAFEREITVANGPRLVFDECEALTAIDVNSAQNVFSNEENLAFRENLLAVETIAQQIQLRNLSGIIIVDFINMKSAEENLRIQSAMEQALANDRIKTVVHGFTSLGLLEITRKRTGNSMLHTYGSKCKVCGGLGMSIDYVGRGEEH